MSATQIVSALHIADPDPALVAQLDTHLAALPNAGNLVDPVKLTVIILGPGVLLQVHFAPGPGGRGDHGGYHWGTGAFQSEQPAPQLGTYRLVINDKEAKLFNGELQVWSGVGQQKNVEGEWIVTLDKV